MGLVAALGRGRDVSALTESLRQVRPGEGLVLFVDLDRALVNPALASLRLSRPAPAILA